MKNKWFFIIAMFVVSLNTMAQTHLEYTTEKHFAKIKNQPQKLTEFLQNMPKGGDLHNHHGGASMAENMLQYAQGEHFCLDANTYVVSVNAECSPTNFLETAEQSPNLYNAIIDAWSMRHFHPGRESGHDHFFATFGKFGAIVSAHSGEVLAEIVARAGKQHELYLELMMTPDHNASGLLGKKIGWNADLAKLREQLLSGGLKPIIADISTALNQDEDKLNSLLHCKTEQADTGCKVKIRYIYQILREQPPEQVFAQLLTGFEIASQDPRVVGINMVQPEDGAISMRDYALHMRMVGFLHQLYPNVHISLHAGELVPGLVPAEGLRFHIRSAVEVAHAERIGHGVDVMHEDRAKQLLQEMAAKHIMVEINLSSNAAILNVSGKNHPLLNYLQAGVPVALSTDDEGVIRTNLTEQYKKAILTYHFSYSNIKELVRNSIAYSFLPGEALWQDHQYHLVVSACKNDSFNATTISSSCQAFLKMNEKAQLQWELEKQFVEFEKQLTCHYARSAAGEE